MRSENPPADRPRSTGMLFPFVPAKAGTQLFGLWPVLMDARFGAFDVRLSNRRAKADIVGSPRRAKGGNTHCKQKFPLLLR
jgi:hypothetical protein